MATKVTKADLENAVADLDATLAERLADAEKDRWFAEAMRQGCSERRARGDGIFGLKQIDDIHRDIYGRPCTAEKEGK